MKSKPDSCHYFNSENAKVYGSKGGKLSGEAKRRKRDMKEALDILLSMPLKTGRVTDVESIRNLAEARGKNLTVEQAMLIAQIQKALHGDTNALLFIRDTSGQKPTENVQVATIELPKFEGEEELVD